MGNYFNSQGSLTSSLINGHHYHIIEFTFECKKIIICKNNKCNHNCRLIQINREKWSHGSFCSKCNLLKILHNSQKILYYNCDDNCDCHNRTCYFETNITNNSTAYNSLILYNKDEKSYHSFDIDHD